MLFCFNNASTPIKPAGWFGLYGGKRVCEYQQPAATSPQGIHLNRMSTEVTHAAVSHLMYFSEAEMRSLILAICVLYQSQQRSDEDWLDLCAANALDFLYTSFNREM